MGRKYFAKAAELEAFGMKMMETGRHQSGINDKLSNELFNK